MRLRQAKKISKRYIQIAQAGYDRHGVYIPFTSPWSTKTLARVSKKIIRTLAHRRMRNSPGWRITTVTYNYAIAGRVPEEER